MASRPNLCPPTATRSSQKPSALLRVRDSVNRVINRIFHRFPLDRRRPPSIPMRCGRFGDAALLRLDAGERQRGTGWRGRVRRLEHSLSSRTRTGRIFARSSAAIFLTPTGFAASFPFCWRFLPRSPRSASLTQRADQTSRRARIGQPASGADCRQHRLAPEGRDPHLERQRLAACPWRRSLPKGATADEPHGRCSRTPRATSKAARR